MPMSQTSYILAVIDEIKTIVVQIRSQYWETYNRYMSPHSLR